MNAPVRVVCRGCLRSVELEPHGVEAALGICPFCGQPLDSRAGSTLGAGVSEKLAADSTEPRPTRSCDTEWTATWSRGSLGVLGRFQLRDRLGDGGFGEVFLAYDPRLDRDVALKVLRQAHPNDRVLERFFREARAAARLDHPNIVAVYDSGYDRGRCWVAYQRVVGKPLWWHLNHRRISPATAARMIRDLAEAIGYAHEHGVVHRDVKPANILIDDHGRPRLIDFGLARRADLDSDLTHDGAIVGTPVYMSPEQAQGHSRQADERSDVFSLGVVLYEAMVGRDPNSTSTARTPTATPSSPTPPSAEDWVQVDSSIPVELIRICKRATSERPEDRYPSARALAADLDAWLQGRAPIVSPIRRGSRLRTVLVWALVLGLGLLLGYLAALVTTSRTFQSPSNAALPPSAPSESPESSAIPDASAADVPAETVRSRTSFVANLDSQILHRATCLHADKISPTNRLELATVDDPAVRDMKACQICKPRIKSTSDRRSSTP